MEFENYLSYDEYQVLGGTLEEMPFNLLEFKARKIIDSYTFGRLKGLTRQIQEVKMCIFELINIINKQSNTSNKTSENIDGYSVSYSTTTKMEDDKEIYDCVYDYLIYCRLEDGTPYLYCGVK